MRTITLRRFSAEIQQLVEPVEVTIQKRGSGQVTTLGIWTPQVWADGLRAKGVKPYAAPVDVSKQADDSLTRAAKMTNSEIHNILSKVNKGKP